MTPEKIPKQFMKGMELSKVFYEEAIRPILESDFPELTYSAGLLGWGSDVLGFDTEQSMDHGWGPRLFLFLSDSDHATHADDIDSVLRRNLPREIRGFPVSQGLHDNGTTFMDAIDEGLVNHGVKIMTVVGYFKHYLGFSPEKKMNVVDWLTIPEQVLRSLARGGLFHDGLGRVCPIMSQLEYYPHDVWLYLLANQWQRIAQEEAFIGRCGQVGDELGSRLVASRLVRDIMRLCFLMEREYAPYIKWFGTAFSQLDSSKTLTPIFHSVFDAKTWQERQNHLIQAYEYVAEMHNDLEITAPLETGVSYFHNRPFLIIQAETFADTIHAAIQDPDVRKLPKFLGSVDQYVDSTDVLSKTDKYPRFKFMYS